MQHISPGFDKSFATWLNKGTDVNVCLAKDGMLVSPGTAVVAPNDYHLEIRHGGYVRLHRGDKVKSHRPSGTLLLRSIAHSFASGGLGLVMTGMGDDGADGAHELESRGGQILVQEPSTAIIDGMPNAAIANTQSAIVDKVSQLARYLRRRRVSK